MVLTRINNQLNQWMGYLKDVLNRPAPENPAVLTEGPLLDIRTGPIPVAEVKRSLKALKNRKAAGCDNIPQRPGRREDWFHPRFSTPPSIRSGMRRSSLRIESWVSWLNFSRREICPYATTGKALCSTLLQAKLFVRSSERMKDFLVDRLWDEQAGFCKERPCCDQIATLRIIVEQTLE